VADVAHHLGLIREHSSLPVAVGFGIKDADSARAVASVADGVVVGSALVAAMARAIDAGGDHEAAMAAAVALLAEIRRGIDHAAS
jgi:tryptophan synthase alpha chain